MKEKSFQLANVDEVTFLNTLYNTLINVGFTCDTTVTEQKDKMESGEISIPSFTFTYKNNKSFIFSRYCSGATNSYTITLSEIPIGLNCRMRQGNGEFPIPDVASMWFRIFYDNYSFFIEYCDADCINVINTKRKNCFGYIKNNNELVTIYSGNTGGSNYDITSYLDNSIFRIKELNSTRIFKLPRYKEGIGFVTDSYPIVANSTIIDSLTCFRACSYIEPNSIVTYEGRRYRALDAFTLIDLGEVDYSSSGGEGSSSEGSFVFWEESVNGAKLNVDGETKNLALYSDLDNKQDRLESGTNIKTINNQSLLGNGDISVDYTQLTNKPKINNIEITGEISLDDIGAQPSLISGTNIKTINNQSLLGEGNITISGGGGDPFDYVGAVTSTEVTGLQTTATTVLGAINELNTAITSLPYAESDEEGF